MSYDFIWLINFKLSIYVYEFCPESIHPCNMKNIYWRRDKKHCTCDNDASVPFKAGTLGPHTVLPIALSCPVSYFPESFPMIRHFFPLRDDFSLGKSQKSQGAKSGLWGSWVTWVIWCFAKKLCMRRDARAGTLSWWSCQSPVAHSCGLVNHPNSFHGGMFKLNAKFDADLLLYSVILNVTATQYTCSPNSVYLPHWLARQCRHCSPVSTPVHSPSYQLPLMSRKPFSLY